LIAKGSDIPTIKRNAGKTISTKVIPSAVAGICFIHCGIPDTPATSFTKTITKIVMPRNASTDLMRSFVKVLYITRFGVNHYY
jgi:hypothetical protein